MALPLGDYPCHHLDHGPDTVEVHREDYEIALDAKEKLKVATGTIRKLRILYAKVQRRYWMEIVDNEQCLPEFNSTDRYHLDGTGADPAETGRRHLTANQWWQVWERVLEKLEAK